MKTTKLTAGLLAMNILTFAARQAHANVVAIPLAAVSALSPWQNLIYDPYGNLYGVGDSSIFELSGSSFQTVTTLASFSGHASQLVTDTQGNFYVSAADGGSAGYGGVYMFSGTNHQTVTTLFSFTATDSYGVDEVATGLVINASGDLFGCTQPNAGNSGSALFKLSGPSHQTFTSTGLNSTGYSTDLGIDGTGNLLAATTNGGTAGDGTVVRVNATLQGTPLVLASFTSAYLSRGGLTTDASGNIYGTLEDGSNNDGEVFELSGSNDQTFTVLATFNGSNGSTPLAGVTIDSNGNIFGTTSQGGLYNDGTVFELSGANHQTLTTLFNYNGARSNGSDFELIDGLTPDPFGNLYTGAGSGNGGAGAGEIIELTNTGFAVPEPASLAMLGIPAAIALLRRRRGGMAILQPAAKAEN